MKKFKLYVEAGGYSLGVNTPGEAVLAAWGDYSNIDGLGYPSIVGEFFESHCSEDVWNFDHVEDSGGIEGLKGITEIVSENSVKIYYEDGQGIYVDVTESLYTMYIQDKLNYV